MPRRASQSIHDKLHQRDLSVPALFKLFDKDGDGRLAPEALAAALQPLGLGLGPAELAALLPGAGADGKVDLLRFIFSLQPLYAGAPVSEAAREVIGALEATMGRTPQRMLQQFHRIDKDHNGLLCMDDMLRFLQELSQEKPEYAGYQVLARAGTRAHVSAGVHRRVACPWRVHFVG